MVVWLKLPEGFLLVHCVRMLVNKLKGLSIWSEMHCYVCLCLTLSLYHITYSNRYFWLECYWNSLPTMAIEIRHWFPVLFFSWIHDSFQLLLCSRKEAQTSEVPFVLWSFFALHWMNYWWSCLYWLQLPSVSGNVLPMEGKMTSFKDLWWFFSGPICKMLLCLFGYECCPRIQDRLSSWETNNTLSEVPFFFFFLRSE